ncbi:MAG: 1-(5-phosphoribosyl)-5-((5-phosphoribosylamino)methylideneamino)imidazole-4-carboxamide isomerase [Ignavibacteriae bacterium]|nr:MAG: 1-(5-phosphoribosyl)-5-((5-phosphoribosylamino)methylideneamino)imidazole-4-carboxamide isomerase [Ignavibacteriota bacterium]
MLVIPVIDIKNGKSVRMVKGLEDKTVFYSESPLSMARLFRKENAKCIHITDLDGAFSGDMINYNTIKEIVDKVGVPIQLGGGIRSFEIAKRLFDDLGVYRLVLGTAVVEKIDLVEKLLAEYSHSKIVVSIDVRDGYFVKTGWTEKTDIRGVELALIMKSMGIKRIIYQDVSRVGTLAGPDFEGLKEIAEKTGLRVTAAGGIGGYPDLAKIQELEPLGVDSVMMSRPIYENRFPCQAIWREAEKVDTSLELPKVK